MGLNHSEQTIIYFYRVVLDDSQSSFECLYIDSIKQVEWHKCKKIIVPINEAYPVRHILKRMHHKVIILKCGSAYQGLFRSEFHGFQVHSFDKLYKEFEECINMGIGCDECPVALIFKDLHESRLKNFYNAFNFYNIKCTYFGSVQQFLETKCQTNRIICGMNQLEVVFECLEKKLYQNPHDLKLNIFCSRDNENQIAKIQKRSFQYRISLQFQENFLKIIQSLLHRTKIPITQRLKIDVMYYLADQKSKNDGSLYSTLKKIQKNIRNIKLKKVGDIKSIPKKISKNILNTFIIDKSIKNFLDICHIIELNGYEDKIYIIRRDSDFNDEFTNRIVKYCEDNTYLGLKRGLKSVIVIGNINYAKKILRQLPFIDIKLFIDQSKQTAIRQNLMKKNQIIIISNDCLKYTTKNQKYSSIIISYDNNEALEPQIQIYQNSKSNIQFCTNQETFRAILYNKSLPFLLNYQYQKKKRSYVGQHINSIINKIKNKQTAYFSPSQQELLFFYCQSWVIDQISNAIIRLFNYRYIGNYKIPECFQRIKSAIVDQICLVSKIDSIEQEVIQTIFQFDNQKTQSNDQLTQYPLFIMKLFVKYQKFRKAINNIFRTLLYQNKIGHIQFTPCLCFILLLSFNKLNLTEASRGKIIYLQIKNICIKNNQASIYQFFVKNSLNYIYTSQFLICQEVSPKNQNHQSLIIQLETDQITNFRCFSHYLKQNNLFIIPPLTKLKINKNNKKSILRLSAKYQQKFYQKFSIRYIECQQQPTNQLFQQSLIPQPLCHFYRKMQQKKYITAHNYLLQMLQQSPKQKKMLYNGYLSLVLIRRGFYAQAQKKINKLNPIYDFIKYYLQSLREKITKPSNYPSSIIKKSWTVNYVQQQQRFSIYDQQAQNLAVYTQVDLQIYSKSKFKQKGPHSQQTQNRISQDSFDKILQDQQDFKSEDEIEQQNITYRVHAPIESNFDNSCQNHQINLLKPLSNNFNQNSLDNKIKQRITIFKNTVYKLPQNNINLFQLGQSNNLFQRNLLTIKKEDNYQKLIKNDLSIRSSSFGKFKNQFHIQLKKINQNLNEQNDKQ